MASGGTTQRSTPRGEHRWPPPPTGVGGESERASRTPARMTCSSGLQHTKAAHDCFRASWICIQGKPKKNYPTGGGYSLSFLCQSRPWPGVSVHVDGGHVGIIILIRTAIIIITSASINDSNSSHLKAGVLVYFWRCGACRIYTKFLALLNFPMCNQEYIRTATL